MRSLAFSIDQRIMQNVTPITLFTLIALIIGPTASAGGLDVVTSSNLTASLSYGFNLTGISLMQQAEGGGTRPNVVDLKLRYLYVPGLQPTQMPDVKIIQADLLNTLQNYPNKSAYWEVLIAAAAETIFRKYSIFRSVELELSIRPSKDIPLLRVGTATLRR
ncbi:hypothetical protein [Deinococcus sp. Leaf326]|jgi:hypothetical protein|uniref:hypothetical protein n=1 Tax=Deinococcus sp. Leaf326 TaxID=1736338 RepID=UPI000ABF7A0B|nr:hypothetical protein [Deinococcus sp. Leaf326]